LIKQTGDGAVVCFGLASRAVRAATELRDELQAIDLTIRQGIHVGEIVVRGDDVSGVAVHVAARVMGLAEPGEILTSAVVPMVVEGDSFEFEKRSEVTLRGLGGERSIYVVGSAGSS
jgi:class 3 adenylate cyclase